MEDDVKKYRKIPVVGEELTEDDWLDVEGMINELKDVGMGVIKILNYKEGSTKFIAGLNNGIKMADIRPKLESSGWKLLSPYHARGKIVGFKVAKDREAKDVNAWGGS
jgi:hypothetical protein